MDLLLNQSQKQLEENEYTAVQYMANTLVFQFNAK